jgi:hypothetical protein
MVKQTINEEFRRMQELAGIVVESQSLNENLDQLISFSNTHLDELKKYFQTHIIFPGLDEEEIENRQSEIDSITKMEDDGTGEAVTPEDNGIYLGVSIKFAEDVDEDFVGDDEEEPEYFELGGRKMAAVWYNI